MIDLKEKTEQKKESTAPIELRSFITVVLILVSVLIFSGMLSYLIPRGSFIRDESGAIIPGTYEKAEVHGLEFWKILTAPIRIFASEDALTVIMISLFLLIMSGVFSVLEKTGGIKIFIGRIMHSLRDKGGPVVCITVLIFMLFGSFFGMFEELVTLLPLVVIEPLQKLKLEHLGNHNPRLHADEILMALTISATTRGIKSSNNASSILKSGPRTDSTL